MSGSTRRQLLTAAAGVAASVSLTGCVGGFNVLGSGGKSQTTKYAERVREATAKYDGDRRAALEDGYNAVLGPYANLHGWHFQNRAYVKRAAEEGGFRLEEPPLLGYDNEGNLTFVEYGGPISATPQTPKLFSDVSEPPEWGVHKAATHLYADPDPTVTPLSERPLDELLRLDRWAHLIPPDPSIEPGDEVTRDFGIDDKEYTRVVDAAAGHPDLRGVHFWVHLENPDGMFAPTHPDLKRTR
jgi:hypothetical protein